MVGSRLLFFTVVLYIFTLWVECKSLKFGRRARRSFQILSNYQTPSSIRSALAFGGRIIKKTFHPPIIPPVLIFLMSVSKCSASPMNRQLIAIKGPFFQGWLARVVDHVQAVSFIFIVGSFSRAGSSQYDEHYVFCGLSVPRLGLEEQVEHFPSTSSVTIRGGEAPGVVPALNPQPLNITWSAHGLGTFQFNEVACSGNFDFPGKFSLFFNSTNRMPWKPNFDHTTATTDGSTGNSSWILPTFKELNLPVNGPEGWLGGTTLLLPCHYFVHSVGSACQYRVTSANYRSETICTITDNTNSSSSDHTDKNTSTTDLDAINYKVASAKYSEGMLESSGSTVGSSRGGDACILSTPSSSVIGNSSHWTSSGDNGSNTNKWDNYDIVGEGYAHIEANHGSFFPEGWIWSQSIADNNTASYSLVLGKFSIAGLKPTNCILYLRRRNGKRAIFRTTDADSVTYVVNPVDGTLHLNATSLLKQQRMEVTIRSPARTTAAAFGATVHVPTAQGFSNRPGCKETYEATATIRFVDLRATTTATGTTTTTGTGTGGRARTTFSSYFKYITSIAPHQERIRRSVKQLQTLIARSFNMSEPMLTGRNSAEATLGAGASDDGGGEEEEEEEEEEVYSFPLSALEYGGSFISKLLHV